MRTNFGHPALVWAFLKADIVLFASEHKPAWRSLGLNRRSCSTD